MLNKLSTVLARATSLGGSLVLVSNNTVRRVTAVDVSRGTMTFEGGKPQLPCDSWLETETNFMILLPHDTL